MLVLVTDGRAGEAGPVDEQTPTKWRWWTGCSAFIFLALYVTAVFWSHESRKNDPKAEERQCRVSSCWGCGRNVPNTCRQQDSVLGGCRRRAQGYKIVCEGCEEGGIEQQCQEFADRQESEIGANRGTVTSESLPQEGSMVSCYASGKRLSCEARTDEDDMEDFLAGRLNGFPVGWAMMAAAGGCCGLFVLSWAARWRRHGAYDDSMQYPGGAQGYNQSPPQFGGAGPAPMPTTLGVPVQGVPVQGMPVMQPTPQLLTIQVPEGHPPGGMMQVQTPSGSVVTVVPPESVGPGGTFQVQY